MPIKFEDETPTKSTIKFDDDVSKISTGGEKTPPSRGEILSDIPKGAVSNLESLIFANDWLTPELTFCPFSIL